jgi:hypothetical protein
MAGLHTQQKDLAQKASATMQHEESAHAGGSSSILFDRDLQVLPSSSRTHRDADAHHAESQRPTLGPDDVSIDKSVRPGGLRRVSASKACVECRRRKIRCDGLKPCGQCQWYQHPEACAYSRRTRRAMPNRAEGIDQHNKRAHYVPIRKYFDPQDLQAMVWLSSENMTSLKGHSEAVFDGFATSNNHTQTAPHQSVHSIRHTSEVTPDPADDGFNYTTSNAGRGRTSRREEHVQSPSRAIPLSRASSTSSVRSMIDERLEWAHQDRVRSASRGSAVPQSPFNEHSPYHADYARELKLARQDHGVYDCDCCPKDTEGLNDGEDLKYVSLYL